MTILERVIDRIYEEFEVKEGEDNSDIDEFIEIMSDMDEDTILKMLAVLYYEQVLMNLIIQKAVI